MQHSHKKHNKALEIKCSYELAEAMLRLAERDLGIIQEMLSRKHDVVELAPHIANVSEFLAKALIYAINIDKDVCEKARDWHDVSELLIYVYTRCPVPLYEDDVKAIAGIAFLNAMLCNRAVRNIIRYGVGVLLHEVATKPLNVPYEWKGLLEHALNLLNKYYGDVKKIVERAGTYVIEVTPHSFSEESQKDDEDKPVKQAKIAISTLRPTAKYAHARVRIRLCGELLNKTYKVTVMFKAEKEVVAPVRCEVCLWKRKDQSEVLVNNDGTGSPKDYIYLIGHKGRVTVYAGKVDNNVIHEIEPRVWKPGGIESIEVTIEEVTGIK